MSKWDLVREELHKLSEAQQTAILFGLVGMLDARDDQKSLVYFLEEINYYKSK